MAGRLQGSQDSEPVHKVHFTGLSCAAVGGQVKLLVANAWPQVLQNGRITTVDSTELLPGDVVVLHPGVLPCDITLVRCGPLGSSRRSSCIVVDWQQ